MRIAQTAPPVAAFFFALALPCCKPREVASGAAAQPDASPVDLSPLARAEDLRRTRDVSLDLRTSHDVSARRRAARALARIADPASLEGLMQALSDEDEETLAWGAYGLGYACRGHEDAHVRALAARIASLADSASPAPSAAARGPAEIDARTAIARAVGRCGGSLAEPILTSWIRAPGPLRPHAVLALGDFASHKKELGDDAMTALLDVATSGPAGAPTIDMAFYALSRIEPKEAFAARVLAAARGALGRPSDARIFAIKALGRVGKDAVPDLLHVALTKSFLPAERAEAARALGSLGDTGHVAAADALAQLTPDKDPFAITALGGPEFSVLLTLIFAVGTEPPKKAEPPLYALAALFAPGEPPPSLGRRLAELRCAAAGALARGAYDADVLKKCDAPTTEASERARLSSLLRRPITADRRAAWRALAKSEHVRIREAAIESIGAHPELGDAARVALVEALGSKKPGLVATAADVILAHPERALVLAASERRAALDPSAPPPTANPARETDRELAKALQGAIAEKWHDDLFETRIALIEAAVAIRAPEARALADAACHDPNTTVRERAAKALRSLGEAQAACPAPEKAGPVAPEIGKDLGHGAKLTFVTDAGELVMRLEPELSPVTAARLAALAKSGFYKGIVVHRVVPGFVVQFGDPDGDGYGGSGTPLRCETSPVAFSPLDVGMALAGRDTGSSQLFVTLSRTPHLDGDYTRVGKAEGDWASVAEGDTIRDVKVSEE